MVFRSERTGALKVKKAPGNGSQAKGVDFLAIKERADEISGFAETFSQGKILCVTNRKLCREDFSERIESIVRASHGRIGGIILREKDLPETEYRELAGKIMEICKQYGVLCILHNFADTAAALGAQAIHLPLPTLRKLSDSAPAESLKESSRPSGAADRAGDAILAKERKAADSCQNIGAGSYQSISAKAAAGGILSRFRIIGASCHSVQDALEAQALGCTYITAGHVFATDCKKGVPPRGLAFLHEVCESVSIPVYAIGGINEENYPQVLQAGAAGACVMSGLMRCENAEEYLSGFAGRASS